MTISRVSNRIPPSEIILSPITPKDLLGLAKGNYAAFPPSWHDLIEPIAKRPIPDSLRVDRYIERLQPWLTSPYVKWTKATLVGAPDEIIGHAAWLIPREDGFTPNHFRRDAVDSLGWATKMGWSDAEVAEMWEHVDLEAMLMFNRDDEVRERVLGVEPHWFLAPLWVLPEWQGRGVSSLLLREVLDLARGTPVWLEAMPEARGVYERFGFVGVEGEEMCMIWRGRGTV